MINVKRDTGIILSQMTSEVFDLVKTNLGNQDERYIP